MPDKPAPFQSLGEQTEPLPVRPQQPQQIAASAAKHKQVTAERILRQLLLHQCCSPSKPLRMSVRPTASHTRIPEAGGSSPFQYSNDAVEPRRIDTGVNHNAAPADEHDLHATAHSGRILDFRRGQ